MAEFSLSFIELKAVRPTHSVLNATKNKISILLSSRKIKCLYCTVLSFQLLRQICKYTPPSVLNSVDKYRRFHTSNPQISWNNPEGLHSLCETSEWFLFEEICLLGSNLERFWWIYCQIRHIRRTKTEISDFYFAVIVITIRFLILALFLLGSTLESLQKTLSICKNISLNALNFYFCIICWVLSLISVETGSFQHRFNPPK